MRAQAEISILVWILLAVIAAILIILFLTQITKVTEQQKEQVNPGTLAMAGSLLGLAALRKKAQVEPIVITIIEVVLIILGIIVFALIVLPIIQGIVVHPPAT